MWQLSNLQIDSSVIQIVQSDVLRNSVDTTAAITNTLYGYGCCTELTEVPGTGSTRVSARPWGRSSIWSGEFNPTCMTCSHWVNVPETIRSCVGIVEDHRRGDKLCEPQRVATRTTAALTATDHSTAYPGGGASKTIMAVASPILPPARSAKCHDNQSKRPKTQRIAQDFDYSCIAVAIPCVAFLGFLRPPKRGCE